MEDTTISIEEAIHAQAMEEDQMDRLSKTADDISVELDKLIEAEQESHELCEKDPCSTCSPSVSELTQ